MSSSISLIIVLQFSDYSSFTSLVNFIPRYSFWYKYKWNCFLHFSFWYCYSRIEMQQIYVLILDPATLLNSFILKFFLVEFLRFSIYSIMSSANNDSFTFSFPIWMCFVCFFLPTMARTSNTVEWTWKSGHPCLVPDVRGKAFCFSPLSIKCVIIYGLYYVEVCSLYTRFIVIYVMIFYNMLCVIICYMSFIMLRYASFIPTWLRFF